MHTLSRSAHMFAAGMLQVAAGMQASTNGTSQARPAAVVQQAPAQPAAKPKPAGMDTSMAVGMAVTHINAGRVEEALQLLDGVIEASTEPNMGALVARGTARALKRDLTGMQFQFCLHEEV